MIGASRVDQETAMIVDACVPHPSGNSLNQQIFTSLRRWTTSTPGPVTVMRATMIAALDEETEFVRVMSVYRAANSGWR